MNEHAQPRTLLDTLPAAWPNDLQPLIRAAVERTGTKIIVLDDDPTGTQTVYDLPVLTEWSVEVLQAELRDPAPCCYILTNTRSVPLVQAEAITSAIGRNLQVAAAATGRAYTIISRSDSTLRGHFPGEVQAVAGHEAAVWLLIPAFFAGGRYTIGDVHYVAEGDQLTPVAATEFARDAAFGYRNSNLRAWVEEKIGGAVQAGQVVSIDLDTIRCGGPRVVVHRLCALASGSICIVNAASQRDVEVVALAVIEAESRGVTFLARSAASYVAARIGLASRPLLRAADLALPVTGGGLVVVGSYVAKTTAQLAALLHHTAITPIELDVLQLFDPSRREATIANAAAWVDAALEQNATVVVFTSRTLLTGVDADESLTIGERVSASLVSLVQSLNVRPRYLIAKGGITSSDLATKGLDVRRATVRGQLLPGVPVWQLGAESRMPGLCYVVFPGNVGGEDALADAVQSLNEREDVHAFANS